MRTALVLLALCALAACTSPTAPIAAPSVSADTPNHRGLEPTTIGEPSRVPIIAGGH